MPTKNRGRSEAVRLSTDKTAPPETLHAALGERGVSVAATVDDDGEPMPLGGRRVEFCWAHAGRRGCVACDVEGETARFTLPAFAAPGLVRCAHLAISGDDIAVCTNDVRVMVGGAL